MVVLMLSFTLFILIVMMVVIVMMMVIMMMVIDNDNGGDGFLCLRHCQSNPALLDHLVVILAFTFQVVVRAFQYLSAFDEEGFEDFSDDHGHH